MSEADQHGAAASRTSTIATDPGSGDAAIWVSATAPAIAMTAPTDRSMPRVAMTSVMPRATSSSTLERRTMSIGPAVEVPVADRDVEEACAT